MKPLLSITALLLSLLVGGSAAAAERIGVAPNHRTFLLEASQNAFVPWGFNYGPTGRLLDDEWENKWDVIERDFRAMRELGANVVRVHLQVPRFMEAADRANDKSLDRLSKLIELAEHLGLYLDITGLGCYRTADVPKWYDGLDETGRWAVQARFWEAVASRGAKSDAVFCYDLMNEPIVPGGRRKPGDWYSGKPFGGFDFVQFITLDQSDRPREEIARQWIRTLSAAVRKSDKHHLITVGLLPWVPQWGHLSGFVPATVAPELDFVCVHIYPEKGKVAEAMDGLKKFAAGKPIVIEETFPLSCGTDDLKTFLLDSRGTACGWMGHYFGESIADLESLRHDKKLTISQAITLDWLGLFRDLGPEMKRPLPSSQP